jgi:hypothetical protein
MRFCVRESKATTTKVNSVRQLSILSLLLVLAGCGGPGGSEVKGTVKFNDGAPLSKGTVVLSNEQNSYRGVVTSEGNYVVSAVASGTYKVSIVGTTVSEEADYDEMEWDQTKGEYVNASKKKPAAAELLAAKFSDPNSSGLTITVPDGPYDLKVESP